MIESNTTWIIGGVSRCGKSTRARRIAQQSNLMCVDMDERVVQAWGGQGNIAACFQDLGAQDFRRLERQVYLEYAVPSRAVIALGGGALLDAEIARITQTWGVCGWLYVPFHVMHARWCISPPMQLPHDQWRVAYAARTRACMAWTPRCWASQPQGMWAQMLQLSQVC